MLVIKFDMKNAKKQQDGRPNGPIRHYFLNIFLKLWVLYCVRGKTCRFCAPLEDHLTLQHQLT